MVEAWLIDGPAQSLSKCEFSREGIVIDDQDWFCQASAIQEGVAVEDFIVASRLFGVRPLAVAVYRVAQSRTGRFLLIVGKGADEGFKVVFCKFFRLCKTDSSTSLLRGLGLVQVQPRGKLCFSDFFSGKAVLIKTGFPAASAYVLGKHVLSARHPSYSPPPLLDNEEAPMVQWMRRPPSTIYRLAEYVTTPVGVVSVGHAGRGAVCAKCGTSDHLQLCSKCKSVRYCGCACQHADWPQHKRVCKRV